MTIRNLDYFYSAQIRRYLEQIVANFSGFYYQSGGENPTLIMVPCQMALTNNMVASIIKNNSDNVANTCPMIAVSVSQLRGRREDVQNPHFVNSLQVTERQIVNGQYTNQRGNSYTVDRIMPMPFELTVTVDIWTSNYDQKLQLIEQILPVIYPGFDIQNGVNALDWTALTTVSVDDIVYTSRTVPIGTNTTELEVASIILKMPLWLTVPAKVKQQKVIHEVITNVNQTDDVITNIDVGNKMLQEVTTPHNYGINISGNIITLVPQLNSTMTWKDLIQEYGIINPTISQLRIYTQEPIENTQQPYIAGTIQYTENPNELLWQIIPSTLPANTLNPINGVINPLITNPDTGLPLVNGNSYLILHDISGGSMWGGITAYTNDIITYNNGWSVTFSAATTNTTEYVLNTYSGTQLKFQNGSWVLSIDGTYNNSMWGLYL